MKAENKAGLELAGAYESHGITPPREITSGHVTWEKLWVYADALTELTCTGSECFEVFKTPGADDRYVILTHGEYR